MRPMTCSSKMDWAILISTNELFHILQHNSATFPHPPIWCTWLKTTNSTLIAIEAAVLLITLYFRQPVKKGIKCPHFSANC